MDRRISKIISVLAAAAIAAGFSGCGMLDALMQPRDNEIGSVYEDISSEDEYPFDFSGFTEGWDGSEITDAVASQNGCVFYSGGSVERLWKWEDFAATVRNVKNAQVCICSPDSIVFVDFKRKGSGGKPQFTIVEKYLENGSVSSRKTVVTGGAVTAAAESPGTAYYIGSVEILRIPSANTECVSVPFESAEYLADSGANVSFPFTRSFSSYTDFEIYYNELNGELGLDELKSDMQTYDQSGGFNAHVVYLYGDMEVSDSYEYTVTRAVAGEGKLDIYLEKSENGEKNSNMVKRQVTVAIPSEYLDSVDPENINWIVYTEEIV